MKQGSNFSSLHHFTAPAVFSVKLNYNKLNLLLVWRELVMGVVRFVSGERLFLWILNVTDSPYEKMY